MPNSSTNGKLPVCCPPRSTKIYRTSSRKLDRVIGPPPKSEPTSSARSLAIGALSSGRRTLLTRANVASHAESTAKRATPRNGHQRQPGSKRLPKQSHLAHAHFLDKPPTDVKANAEPHTFLKERQ